MMFQLVRCRRIHRFMNKHSVSIFYGDQAHSIHTKVLSRRAIKINAFSPSIISKHTLRCSPNHYYTHRVQGQEHNSIIFPYYNFRQYSTNAEEDLSLSNPKVVRYISKLQDNYTSCLKYGDEESQMTVRNLRPVILLLEEADTIQKDVEDLKCMADDADNDAEMRQMAKDDLHVSGEKLRDIEEEVLHLLLPSDSMDDTDILLEVSAGVGGQEAMLFCQEVFNMYKAYADYMGWDFDVTDLEGTDIGGVRHAAATIRGDGAYRLLKFEGGTHRVQRVPKTEKAGRIHTSTVSVAVMPQPSEIDIQISEKDLRMETKRASGAGGQHVNTTDSAVRIVHIPTGIAVESQKERSQHRNKDECMKKLRAYLYQVQLDQAMSQYTSDRKLQVGTKSRSEKIRTYNYPQDRVTDHRIGLSLHNLQNLLAGADDLHGLICKLYEAGQQESLWELITSAQ